MLEAAPEVKRPPRTFPFTASASIHAAVLGWVALAPLVPPPRPSLYEQEIRPYENKIVWYNLNERLPEISPPQRDTRPARARTQSRQTLVAGSRDDVRAPQLIYTPAPEIERRELLPAPNVVALAPAARPLRDFTMPPELVHPKPAEPTLPDAPAAPIVELKQVAVAPPPGPRPRPFTPPTEEHPPSAMKMLPSAPELAMAMDHPGTTPLLPPIQPARRTFIPPLEAAHAPATQPANLPAAPAIEAKAASSIPLLGAAARPLRPFAAPAAEHPTEKPTADLPAAPQVAAKVEIDSAALPEMRVARVLRPFAAPERQPHTAPAASLAEAPATINRPTETALAIVSPFPVHEAPIPAPKSSQQAGFSQGPQPRGGGGNSSAGTSGLTVPGLLVRNGSADTRPTLLAALEPPTSRTNLAAAVNGVGATPPGAADSSATRVTTAPDPRLAGRVVYSVAIQMPNISSYSGSWIIWFAESEPLPGQTVRNMQAPRPVRKVDPKYFPAAVDEKVEGKVRLAGVIRKDGHVDGIELLQHLDNRLDQSSLEALAKWEFAPAQRNGIPIDVDAVFEIPFHIAPKAPK